MKTKELAQQLFIRASSRLRAEHSDDDVQKEIAAAAKWAKMADTAFAAEFPESQPKPALAADATPAASSDDKPSAVIPPGTVGSNG